MEEFIAGAAAGASGLIIGHPLEVLKVQLQVQHMEASQLAAGGRGGRLRWATNAIMSRGLSEGAFRGLTLPLVSFAAINSVFFGVYSHAMARLEAARPHDHHGNAMLAGMIGGAAQLPLVTPIEMVKTVLQAQVTRSRSPVEFYRGPIHCALSIVRSEGLIGLNRGFAVTSVRDIPSYGLYMLIYDWLATVLTGHVSSGAAATILAGGLAGSISWLPVLPIDTVKSIMQADMGAGRGIKKRSGLAVARQLYASHGVRGFFRGGMVASLTSLPASGVTFYVWEQSLRLMNCKKPGVSQENS